jgi:hypothetical protein
MSTSATRRTSSAADRRCSRPAAGKAFARSSGNPLEPTVGETIDAALGPSEARELVEHVRPLVERGEGAWRIAVAYLWAS